MGDKSIKNSEKKKKKKVEIGASNPSVYLRPVVTQPELITKKKKVK